MKIRRIIALSAIIVPMLLPAISYTCTTFCFPNRGDWIYGRNYDWSVEHCLIIVNKHGVAKTAMTEDNPAQWVSKYGSVTFNQYGREFPLGGMNEAGLVIECMWLEHTEYRHVDARAGLSALQWIQYQLDNFALVDQVIASDRAIRIAVRNATPLHFLVCDSTGRAATIEFLKGEMVVHTKDDLVATALTNNTYEYCMRLFEIYRGDETSAAFSAADYSLKRFVWAAKGVKEWNPKVSGDPIEYAFQILEKAAVDVTMFRIVYDPGNRHIYYQTRSNPDIRFIDCSKFDFSCSTPVKILDISYGKKGNATGLFADYTYEANYDFICKSFSGTSFLKNTPADILQRIAGYPEALQCQE